MSRAERRAAKAQAKEANREDPSGMQRRDAAAAQGIPGHQSTGFGKDTQGYHTRQTGDPEKERRMHEQELIDARAAEKAQEGLSRFLRRRT